MHKQAPRRPAGAAPAAGAGAPPRGVRLVPLLGGMLFGAAFPLSGAATEGDPPLRLRLSEAIGNLSRSPAPPAVPDALRPGPVAAASPWEFPHLRLARVLSGAGIAPGVPPSSSPRLAATAARPLPEKGDALARAPRSPIRPEEPVAFAALEEVSPQDAQAGAIPGTPAVPQGAVTAAVVGDDEFLPADELDLPLPTGPRPPPGGQRPGGSQATGGGGRGWGMAPVRWGGVLSAGLQQRRSDGAQSSTQQMYEARLRANSYLVQPYIALISGDFGLTLLRSQEGGDGSAAARNLTGTSLNGSGTLSVFPQSRFPFQASLALSDSRSDGSLTNTDTTRRRLSLRQDYRPPVGQWRTSGQYDRSELTGSFGRDTVDVFAGTFMTVLGDHNLSANGSLSRNLSEEGITRDRLALARHGYRFSDAFSLETTGTYTGQEFDVSRPGFKLRGDTQTVQLFSFASWTPYESKWRGTANLRYLQSESNTANSSFETRNLGASTSLSYQASRNLSLFGALNANVNARGDRRDVSSSQTLGLNYSGDPRSFGPYTHSWYGAGSFSNNMGSEGDSQRSASASAGHSLQRYWRLSEITSLNGNLSQSVSTSRSTGIQSVSSTTLTHGANLSLQANPSDRLSGFLGASVSDSRSTGDNTSTFQLLNLQLSGAWRINVLSELTSNLTWQLARQESSHRNQDGPSTTSASQSSSMSGSLGYRHARAFGVRGLHYTADFRANTNQSDSRRSGNVDAARERITLDLDQRLRYRIGRLGTELQARVAEVEGRRESLAYFKVTRDFGAF